MEGKAAEYISNSYVTAVLILDLDYPQGNWARVSLLVDNGMEGHRWAHRREVIYDIALGSCQPCGQIGLYISDFLGGSSLPAAFCRPPAGISRYIYSYSLFYS